MVRKKIGSLIMASVFVLTLVLGKISANEVLIKDHNLKVAINRELGKDEKYNPTKSDLKSLKQLMAIESHIRDISGLELAENLEILDLSRNEIADASPLKNLKNLKSVAITSQVVEVKKEGNIAKYPVVYRDGKVLDPYDTGDNADYKDGKLNIKDSSKPASVTFLAGDMSGTIKVVDKVEDQTLISQKDVVVATQIDGQSIEESVESDQRMKENPEKEAKARVKLESKNTDKSNSNILIYGVGIVLLAGCIALLYKMNFGKKRFKK